ncbi:hypothetical protein K1719_016331 [Acacia pycnantha]|nr:hypothetical protein K1719_016331 [Acacia pycnantha]
MRYCSPSVAPIVKGDEFNLDRCLKNDFEREQMKNNPYASTISSLMYAHVSETTLHLLVGIFGEISSNPVWTTGKAVKKVLRYLQGTKDYVLKYKLIDNLEVLVTTIQIILAAWT